MGKITGFKDFKRENLKRRNVSERVNDWKEIYLPWTDKQAMSRLQDVWIVVFHFVIMVVH